MSRMANGSMIIAGMLAIASLCDAQHSEPIPPDMMGTPGTIVGFVRDTACLLRNKSASVAKDAESRKCIIQCVQAVIATNAAGCCLTQVSTYARPDGYSNAVEFTRSVSPKSKSYQVGDAGRQHRIACLGVDPVIS
jgi:hypothetical protein